MNATNITNATAGPAASKNPWEESGAMVYVALTVATFAAVTMCCVWFFKQRWLKTTTYGTVHEEDIELTGDSSSEEELPLDDEIPLDDYKDDPQTANPDSSAFTLDASDDEEEQEEDHSV